MFVVLATTHDTIRVIDATFGRTCSEWAPHPDIGALLCVAVSDGAARLCITGCAATSKNRGGEIALWSIPDGALKWRSQVPSRQLQAAAFNDDATRIALIFRDPATFCVLDTVCIIDAATGAAVCELSSAGESIQHAAFVPRSNLIATCSSNARVVLWNAETGTAQRQEFRCSMVYSLNFARAVTVSPDATLLLMITDSDVIVWNLRSSDVMDIIFSDQWNANCVVFSPDSTTLAHTSFEHGLRCLDLATWQLKCEAPLGGRAVAAIRFSLNGRFIMASVRDDRCGCYVPRMWRVDATRETLVEEPDWQLTNVSSDVEWIEWL